MCLLCSKCSWHSHVSCSCCSTCRLQRVHQQHCQTRHRYMLSSLVFTMLSCMTPSGSHHQHLSLPSTSAVGLQEQCQCVSLHCMASMANVPIHPLKVLPHTRLGMNYKTAAQCNAPSHLRTPPAPFLSLLPDML